MVFDEKVYYVDVVDIVCMDSLMWVFGCIWWKVDFEDGVFG